MPDYGSLNFVPNKGGFFMIYDSHTHASTLLTEIAESPHYTFDKLVNDMNTHGITKSLVMVNPVFRKFRCPLDIYHKVIVQDTEQKGILRLYCSVCDKILYEGPDPTRKYNEELITNTSNYPNRFFTMLYLLMSNSSIPSEIEYFENKYSTSFTGYKLHPRLSFRELDSIVAFPSKRPIVVHIGIDFPEPITNANFVKNYQGNIILAHVGRFHPGLLKLARTLPNVYIDVSPSSLIYQGRETHICEPFNSKISEPADIYKYLIESIGEDKVLFGTDVPWGNYETELNILNSVNLSENTYNKITHLNLINALKRV